MTTRKPTKEELDHCAKGLYWHPERGWLIDEPNITTPIELPEDQMWVRNCGTIQRKQGH